MRSNGGKSRHFLKEASLLSREIDESSESNSVRKLVWWMR